MVAADEHAADVRGDQANEADDAGERDRGRGCQRGCRQAHQPQAATSTPRLVATSSPAASAFMSQE